MNKDMKLKTTKIDVDRVCGKSHEFEGTKLTSPLVYGRKYVGVHQ